MISLGFGAPLFLLGLLALPVIWWLLKMTPPRPAVETFPPFKILARLIKREKTPSKSPWWLILLRLALTALVITALAQPIWKPQDIMLRENRPLVLVIDNSWTSAESWQNRTNIARSLVRQAEEANAPIYIITSVAEPSREIGPFKADEAAKRLETLAPYPLYADRVSAMKHVNTIAKSLPDFQLAYLSDGLAGNNDKIAFNEIRNINAAPIWWYNTDISSLIGLQSIENSADALVVTALRADSSTARQYPLIAYDRDGRAIGEAQLTFKTSEKTASARFALPVEMRNDVAWIRFEDVHNGASTYLIGSAEQRRRVAILAPATGEMMQPLLSPLYYPTKALSPFSEIIHAGTGELSRNIDTLLASRPAILVMGDQANIPPEVQSRIDGFIRNGGTLLRFAGPNLAAAEENDILLPVQLRRGERALGGVMSWAEPQKIAPFDKTSPFADLTPPEDVTISRQILPEPSADLPEKSWISLTDGTPLVTAETRGQGRIVFIHTSADPAWSNLPLSGFFVDMLRRIVTMANQPVNKEITDNGKEQSLSPWRILSADGSPSQPPAYVKPLIRVNDDATPATFSNPPGLYGDDGLAVAVNLLDKKSQFIPLEKPDFITAELQSYVEDGDTVVLGGFLWAIAALLLAVDSFIMLTLGGAWRRRINTNTAFVTALTLAAGTLFCFLLPPPVQAHEPLPDAPLAQLQDTAIKSQAKLSDSALAAMAGKTHLAYVITGDVEVDRTSKYGLQTLSSFIERRTTIEPGEVIGLDIEKDELAFYPLIYWPITTNTSMPSQLAISRIDAYMRQGGTVLFDTRDQMTAGMNLDGGTTPEGGRLKEILGGLNIPPLEPAPQNHVIARSFYIMPDFPGRYRGSPLWVVASHNDDENRPISTGDGVSPILITANDLAGAWASNDDRGWIYATVPDDSMQRVWAFRGGLNIVMYMLSGNYKADQVHVPELLQRLKK